MDNPVQVFANFKKEKDFLLCIDSDGCAFDAMEIKHKECFAPNFIKYWNLQAVSRYAREVWEYVNLYSNTRGCNRFHALIRCLNLLAERPDVLERGYKPPDITSLRQWTANETQLSNPALKCAVDATGDAILAQTLEWTIAVNRSIGEMIHGVPPFTHVREVLEKAFAYADLMVVSATPEEALKREWNEHGLTRYMKLIAGQEAGTKKEHIHLAMAGRYENSKVIKLGDAPGDLEAARANGVNFYPILPGREEESWKRFLEEGLDKFLNGKYAGQYEDRLIAEFTACLPAEPSWK